MDDISELKIAFISIIGNLDNVGNKETNNLIIFNYILPCDKGDKGRESIKHHENDMPLLLHSCSSRVQQNHHLVPTFVQRIKIFYKKLQKI